MCDVAVLKGERRMANDFQGEMPQPAGHCCADSCRDDLHRSDADAGYTGRVESCRASDMTEGMTAADAALLHGAQGETSPSEGLCNEMTVNLAPSEMAARMGTAVHPEMAVQLKMAVHQEVAAHPEMGEHLEVGAHPETGMQGMADASVEIPVEENMPDMQPDSGENRPALARKVSRAVDRAGWARWRRVLDATQPVSTSMPLWPGDPETTFSEVALLEQDGYRLRSFSMGEHGGTHVTAPSSFIANGVPVEHACRWPLVAPLVVLDLRARTLAEPAACCSVADIHAWEARYGLLPAGSFVACNTGWHAFWNDPSQFLGINNGGGMAFPAFASEAVHFLCTERKVSGIGIDTHGVDMPGDDAYSCNRTAHEAGAVVVECLGSLDEAPARGAWVIIAPLRLVGGTGAPVSVSVLLP